MVRSQRSAINGWNHSAIRVNPYYNHEKSRISDKIFKPPMR